MGIDKTLDEMLKRAVKNYNARIRRLEKKAFNAETAVETPQRLSASAIKANYTESEIKQIVKGLTAKTKKRKPKITEDEETRLKKTVKNYNAKITRMEKQGLPTPDKISYKEIIQKFETGRNVNDTLQFMQAFNERGGYEVVKLENGIEITRAELNKIRKQLEIVNQRRAEQRQKIGEPEPGNLAQMGRMRDVNLMPKRDITEISREHLKRYITTLDKQTEPDYYLRKNIQYRDNYISMLRRNFGDDPRTEDAIKYIMSLDLDDFITASLGSDYLFILFYRDPIERDAQKEIVFNNIYRIPQRQIME